MGEGFSRPARQKAQEYLREAPGYRRGPVRTDRLRIKGDIPNEKIQGHLLADLHCYDRHGGADAGPAGGVLFFPDLQLHHDRKEKRAEGPGRNYRPDVAGRLRKNQLLAGPAGGPAHHGGRCPADEWYGFPHLDPPEGGIPGHQLRAEQPEDIPP